jgi:hypothetical protein
MTVPGEKVTLMTMGGWGSAKTVADLIGHGPHGDDERDAQHCHEDIKPAPRHGAVLEGRIVTTMPCGTSTLIEIVRCPGPT